MLVTKYFLDHWKIRSSQNIFLCSEEESKLSGFGQDEVNNDRIFIFEKINPALVLVNVFQ